MVPAFEDVEGVELSAPVPLADKGKPMPITKKHILYKYRIIYFKLLSASKIHAMTLIDIVGSKTLAYKDAFKNESPGSGLLLGNRPGKAGCQEHVSLLSDCVKSRQTDR